MVDPWPDPDVKARGSLAILGYALAFVTLVEWLRTWGVLLLLGVGLALPALSLHSHAPLAAGHPTLLAWPLVHQLGLLSAAFLCSATVPFIGPIAAFVSGKSGRAG